MRPRMLCWKTAVLLAALARLAPVPAFADGGNISGGNSIRLCKTEDDCSDHFISTFQADSIGSMKGYSIFKAQVEELRKDLPDFADAIEKAADKKVWYRIPEDFKGVSVEKHKLLFSTVQSAYQTDKEIFTSDLSFKNMSEADAAVALWQETLEAMLPDMDPVKARVVAGRLFTPSASTDSRQTALLENGYGLYLTPAAKKRIRQKGREAYVDYLRGTIDNAYRGQFSAHCEDRNFDEKREMEIYHVKDRAGIDRVYVERTLGGMGTPENPGSWDWRSPFEANIFVKGGLFSTAVSSRRKVTSSVRDDLRAKGNYSERLLSAFEAFDAKGDKARTPAEDAAWSKILSQLEPALDKDTRTIIRAVGDSPAFADFLALGIRVTDAVAVRDEHDTLKFMQWNLRKELADRSKENDPNYNGWIPVLDTVASRLNGVPVQNPVELHRRFCDELRQLAGAIEEVSAKVSPNKPKPVVRPELENLDNDSGGVPARQGSKAE